MGDILTETKDGIKSLMVSSFSSLGQKVEILVGYDAMDVALPPNKFPRLACLNIAYPEVGENQLLTRNQVAQQVYLHWDIDFRVGAGGTMDDKLNEACPVIAACYDGLIGQNPRESNTDINYGDKLSLLVYAFTVGFYETGNIRIPVIRQSWRCNTGIITNT